MKNKQLLLNGMLSGMKSSGAELVKTSETHLYFTIQIGSDIDNEGSLKRAKQSFYKEFGLGIKIKRIN